MTESAPYVQSGLWSSIEAALVSSGKDPLHLSDQDVAAIDHFHHGGLQSTTNLFKLIGPLLPGPVLDLGSSIGGGARYLAKNTKAPVIAADLSTEHCVVGHHLADLLGLSDGLGFVATDAANLAFDSESFSLVWMQNVAMNIADKAALYSEVARVLKPGGVFAFQEIVAGTNPGPLVLPVPWAVKQEDSHLEGSDRLRERLTTAGLREVHFEDPSDEIETVVRRGYEAARNSGAPALGVHLLFTAARQSISAATTENLALGRIRWARGVSTKPSA